MQDLICRLYRKRYWSCLIIQHNVYNNVIKWCNILLSYEQLTQEEAYSSIESILWKTTYLVDSKAAHFSKCETASLSECEFSDPVNFTPFTSPRPEGDGCDKDHLDQNQGKRNISLTQITSTCIRNLMMLSKHCYETVVQVYPEFLFMRTPGYQ